MSDPSRPNDFHGPVLQVMGLASGTALLNSASSAYDVRGVLGTVSQTYESAGATLTTTHTLTGAAVWNMGPAGGGGGGAADTVTARQGSRAPEAATGQAWYVSEVAPATNVSISGTPTVSHVSSAPLSIGTMPALGSGTAQIGSVAQGSSGLTAWPVKLSEITAATGASTVAQVSLTPVPAISIGTLPALVSGDAQIGAVSQGTGLATSASGSAWLVRQMSTVTVSHLTNVPLSVGTMPVLSVGTLPALVSGGVQIGAVSQGSSGATAWPVSVSAPTAVFPGGTGVAVVQKGNVQLARFQGLSTSNSNASATTFLMSNTRAGVATVMAVRVYNLDSASNNTVSLIRSNTAGSTLIEQYPIGVAQNAYFNYYPMYVHTIGGTVSIVASQSLSNSVGIVLINRTTGDV